MRLSGLRGKLMSTAKVYAFLDSGTPDCQNFVLGLYMAFQGEQQIVIILIEAEMCAPFWTWEPVIVNRQ